MDIKLVAVLIFGTITQTLGWRPFKVEMQNVTYESIQPEIIGFNLTMRNRSAFDVHLNVLQDVSQPFLDFKHLLESSSGVFDMVFTNKTVDLCMFLNKRKSNALFDIVYRMLSDYGDLPKNCPIRRQRYGLVNVILDPEKYPPILPDHKAKFSVVVWNKLHGKKNILMKFGAIVVIERAFKGNAKG